MAQKKKTKDQEPAYYLSPTHMQAINYKVYYMSKGEKIVYFLAAFCLGALIGYLFYGGIGKDEFGNPTETTRILDIIIPTVCGLVAGKLFLPIRTKQILNKRKSRLAVQFRDMLDGLTTSLGAGNNVLYSFSAVYEDLKIQYSEDAYIIQELAIILSGLQSNFELEGLLMDFGARSGIEDIQSFAKVFQVAYRKGGNIQDIIRSTHAILSKKMEIKADIETTISGSKMDQMIMLVLPVLLIALIKLMSPEFASNFTTPIGIVSTTIAIGMFIVSYFVGKTIMDIKI